MSRGLLVRFCVISSLVWLASCGGGGGGSPGTSTGTSGSTGGSGSAATPASGASETPAQPATGASDVTAEPPTGASQPAVTAPTLAAATAVIDGTTLGTPQWSAGSTSTGGTGAAVGGLNCTVPSKSYTYSHLSIYQNGQLLSLPANIGSVAPTLTAQTGCVYPVHTVDSSGKIRMDASTGASYTLGQFFAIWGQPLSSTNIAGLTGTPVTAYVTSGGVLTQYTGDLASLVLPAHGEVTIVIGTALTQIPTYAWTDPPPFATTPIALNFGGVVGSTFWTNGDTATGGQGATVDDILCSPNMSVVYHVHAHLAIFKDGQSLALPSSIGIPAPCIYEMHTHDQTGIIHLETPSLKSFTLGKFFDVWGQPLSATNVAGITGDVVVYINDNGDVRRYMGDVRAIELTSLRSITLQIGTPVSTLPIYTWDEAK
jgi:hypothetical protein